MITAVTTGTIGPQASHIGGNTAVGKIVAKVIAAAYGAFAHGLDLALLAATALMLLAAIIAAIALRPHGGASEANEDF